MKARSAGLKVRKERESILGDCEFSSHGFKLSPMFGEMAAQGEIAAQLTIDGGTEHNMDMFSPGEA